MALVTHIGHTMLFFVFTLNEFSQHTVSFVCTFSLIQDIQYVFLELHSVTLFDQDLCTFS